MELGNLTDPSKCFDISVQAFGRNSTNKSCRDAAKPFVHGPFLLKIQFLTSCGIRSRSRRERMSELGVQGCSEPPNGVPGGEAPGKLWI